MGYPNDLTPNALSRDKLLTRYSHTRRLLGKISDTRRLMVILPEDKRASTVELLSLWISKHHFTILDQAQLIGILDSNATLCRWARADYFVLLNFLQDQFRATYQIVARQIKAAKKTSATSSMHTFITIWKSAWCP